MAFKLATLARVRGLQAAGAWTYAVAEKAGTSLHVTSDTLLAVQKVKGWRRVLSAHRASSADPRIHWIAQDSSCQRAIEGDPQSDARLSTSQVEATVTSDAIGSSGSSDAAKIGIDEA